jgi:hypothetical protein
MNVIYTKIEEIIIKNKQFIISKIYSKIGTKHLNRLIKLLTKVIIT